ncbi:MAG: hypothetical protein Q8L68_02085 [Methylococcales bacterium]|nr:hypothetical protein [Methylococcales bacterium]
MMKRTVAWVTAFFLFFMHDLVFSMEISDYQRISKQVITQDGKKYIAIRSFKMNKIPTLLIVNVDTLKTNVVDARYVVPTQSNDLGDSTYTAALDQYTHSSEGFQHAKTGVMGTMLTIDLCPASGHFEKQFFERLAALSTSRPIPVAISISGLWLKKHRQAFQYLVSLQQEKKLEITWVNHTYSHPYDHTLPDTHNFLLLKHVNVDQEILQTEQLLLAANQMPSIFLRFPGLVSSPKLMQRLYYFGLIPLDSNAWLAKDQPIKPGAIVLVHGNGNEPLGIHLLTPQLKRWHWISLYEGLNP